MADLIISKARTKDAVKECNVSGEFYEALDKKVAFLLPDDLARVNRAINRGAPVVLRHPWAKISRSIRSMSRSLNGHHSEKNGSPAR